MSESRPYEIRTVDRLIAVINQGDDGAEATKLYEDIMVRLAQLIQDHGGKFKASLVMTIAFTADERGLDVQMSSKAKLPDRPVLKERYFMSRENVLTMQDPGRDSLFPGTDLGRRGSPREVGDAS